MPNCPNSSLLDTRNQVKNAQSHLTPTLIATRARPESTPYIGHTYTAGQHKDQIWSPHETA
jgi:hypothetical protein